MRDMERLQLELHAKLPAFKRKVDKARAIIDEALSIPGRWYLAFSGGVDSLCVLHMLQEQISTHSIDVHFGDSGFDYPENLQFLQDCEARYGFCLHRVRRMKSWQLWCEEMGRPDLCNDPAALEAWGNPRVWDSTQYEALHEEQYEYSGVWMGLLASESRARRLVLHNGNRALYQVNREHGMWHCSPLASWDKRDVWAYIASREVSYNPVYDKLAELGLPLEQRRVGPLTCFRVVQYGSVVALRQGWTEMYNRLSATFPKVREYS